MPQSVVEKKKYTYEDYLKTSEGGEYELIEGELLMTPAPTPKHQRISGKLEFVVRKFVTDHDLGEVFDAPCDVCLDNENVVQPDILFISKARLHIIGEKNIQGAPDLVIEIISENTAYRDLVQKKKLYAQFGIREYWIVIPEEEVIQIYTLKEKIYALHRSFGRSNTLESPHLKNFKLRLKDIF